MERKEQKYLNQSFNERPNLNTDENISDIEPNNILARSHIDFKGMENFQFKIILLGEAGVGKSSIIRKFITNEFKSIYQATIGVEFKTKDIYIGNSYSVKLNIWDTCGQEKFRAITRQYYNNTNGVFLVYDLSDKNSFEKLNVWLNDIKDNMSNDVVLFLIGNKLDIKDRDISISEEGKIFANKNKIPYYEISAKNGTGIYNIFEKISKHIIEQIKAQRMIKEEQNKLFNRNLNLDNYNKDRGKIEKNESSFRCC